MFKTITLPYISLWLILFLALLVYTVISIVFVYHWRKFAKNEKAALAAETLYFFVSFVFISGAFLSLLPS